MLGVLSDLVSGLYAWLTSLCCAVNCTTTTMKVNERNCKVVKMLAEGGFSFVYLVEDGKTKYALKKVLSQLPETSQAARWEIQVHKSFKHPNLLQLIDSCMVPAANGAEEFRLLMPLFEGGTLLDRALMHLKAGTHMAQKDCLRIFEGVLQGVLQFHTHSPPWAHRDIKPANVLLGPGDAPVLMDFGSAAIARKRITNRQEALLLQEDAAQNCSMPYRAPELFDVPSDSTIDERTDIFSLGKLASWQASKFLVVSKLIVASSEKRCCSSSSSSGSGNYTTTSRSYSAHRLRAERRGRCATKHPLLTMQGRRSTLWPSTTRRSSAPSRRASRRWSTART